MNRVCLQLPSQNWFCLELASFHFIQKLQLQMKENSPSCVQHAKASPVQNALVQANYYFYRNIHIGIWFFTGLERFAGYFSCSINSWMTNRDSFWSYSIKTVRWVGSNLACYFSTLEDQNSVKFLVLLGPIRYLSFEEALGMLWPEATIAAHRRGLC